MPISIPDGAALVTFDTDFRILTDASEAER